MFKNIVGFVALGFAASFAAESATDVFGFKKIYETKSGTVEWNSAHWANGTSRNVNWSGDPSDPFGWTENHSAGSADPYFKIDGAGVMQMMSTGPRFHINSMKGSKQQFYKNVEFTGYFRRGKASEGGADYGGMVVGLRTGALGHNSSGGDDCDATTYYARFRHDGKWDFEKEWKHPDSYYQSMGVIGQQTPLWGSGKMLPTERWIGMKYIVFNPTETSVKLELYIDSISGGNPSKAVWEKVGEALDEGKDWSGAKNGASTISGCSYTDAKAAILEGHGTVLMRTDAPNSNQVNGEYKFVTVREIDPTKPFESGSENTDIPQSSMTGSSSSGVLYKESLVDEFGSSKLYPTAEGSLSWNSKHWESTTAYGIDWRGDSYDPTGWTESHSYGGADPYFKVDGHGVMQMMSPSPRFHINSMKGSKTQFYKNVEFTGYYRHTTAASDGKNYAGMVVGVRSGPLGHGTSGGNDCDASTYYARFRHDGKWDLEKEWKHPASYYQSMGTLGKQARLWDNNRKLPMNRWIGMKFVVYNPTAASVKLELYIDSISGGDPSKAVWQKVDEALDEGKDWSGAGAGVSTISGCKDYNGLENAYDAILEGHGTVLMRTDAVDDGMVNQVLGEYKYITIREIDPFGSFESGAENPVINSSSSGEVGSSGSTFSSSSVGGTSSSSSAGVSSSSSDASTAIRKSHPYSVDFTGVKVYYDLNGRRINKKSPTPTFIKKK